MACKTIWPDQVAEDAELFKDVEFVIEATSTEQHYLWCENDRNEYNRKVTWVEVSMGHAIPIGSLDGRPVNVSLSYAVLNGVRVMFYYGVSQVVDHKMIEEWLRYHTENLRYGGGRWSRCDAMNFAHCLQYVRGEK